jgi:hypothetical protein
MSRFAPGTYIVAIQASGRTYTGTLMRRWFLDVFQDVV